MSWLSVLAVSSGKKAKSGEELGMLVDFGGEKNVSDTILDRKRATHATVAAELGDGAVRHFALTSIILGEKPRECGNLALRHAWDSAYRLRYLRFPDEYYHLMIDHDNLEDGADTLEKMYLLAGVHADLFGEEFAQKLLRLSDVSSMILQSVDRYYGKPNSIEELAPALDKLQRRVGRYYSKEDSRGEFFADLHSQADAYFNDLEPFQDKELRAEFMEYLSKPGSNPKSDLASVKFMKDHLKGYFDGLEAIAEGVSEEEIREGKEEFGESVFRLADAVKARAYHQLYVAPIMKSARDKMIYDGNLDLSEPVAKGADVIDNVRTMIPFNRFEQHKSIYKAEVYLDQARDLLKEMAYANNNHLATNKSYGKELNFLKKELLKQVLHRANSLWIYDDTAYVENQLFLEKEYERLRDKYEPPLSHRLLNSLIDAFDKTKLVLNGHNSPLKRVANYVV
jgi:hypothetical protein